MCKHQKRKQLSSSLRRGMSVFLAAVITIGLLPYSSPVSASDSDDVIEISSYAQLKAQAMFTTAEGGNQNFEGKTLKLTGNIQAPVLADDASDSDIAYATCIFGSEENPFKGTFDGNGYTISGLRYREVWDEPRADTGLFAVADGAVIENLTIESADIESDIRGGIVVGYANNTLINHVTVKNSSLSVAAADNVLLIGTDLGIRGGGIAGQVNNSVLYDCEVNNCWIRSNNTSAVAALAGKPLTLGGLVGCAEGSTIEYSRVIGDTPYDADAPYGTGAAGQDAGKTRISIHYDVVVGAVGGNTLYVGGIAGRIWSDENGKGDKGTAIIDCYSTAEMYYYCATYVSVLGINIGHIGGVTAEVWDDNCSITRCHYAGLATSEQYNAFLVFPIMQEDVNISGVADIWQGSKDAAWRQIYGSFFKSSLNDSNEEGMSTLGNGLTGEISSNGNFGPWADSLYVTRSAWETFGFDFTGTQARTSDYDSLSGNPGGSHSNKWVMDYELGIPVHGSSVAVTLDFPGAGTASINATGLVGQAVSTSDPTAFAVQGVYQNENSLTLEYTPASELYRLYGWYRFPDVLDDTAPEDHSYFTNLYETYAVIKDVPVYGANGEQVRQESVSNPVSADNVYTPVNTENQPVQWQDNDLFTARIQALVTFHNYTGSLIGKDGVEKTETGEEDWYFYEDGLPAVVPAAAPGDANTTLLGWTTRAPEGFGSDYPYTATSPSTLQDMKNAGEFYETGALITKPMELYPVYAGLASNAITQFEGYMYDAAGSPVEESLQNQANRPGVGTTSAAVDLAGGPTNASVTLTVAGTGENGRFPEGYRFLGWYEDGHCISREESATITGVDLTQEHTYLARFEYAVNYWEKCQYTASNNDTEYKDSKIYTTIWHDFEEPFQEIAGLNFYREAFRYWGTSHDYQEDRSNQFTGNIVAPANVYSCNELTGGDSTHDYDLDVLNDFPTAGSITAETDGLADRAEFTISVNPGYNFMGWTWEKEGLLPVTGTIPTSGTDLQVGANLNLTSHFVFFGHYTANINYHALDGQPAGTVTRRYQQPLFAPAGSYSYTYYLADNQDKTPDKVSAHTYTALPSKEEMAKDGYVFLGWVDGDGLVNGDGSLTAEGRYLWDRYADTGEFLTSDPDRAALYVLPEDALVYSTMELYPVYAKYDITYTTNFEQAGIEETDAYNVPELPVETGRTPAEDNRIYTVSFTVDNDTPVLKADASAGVYVVSSVELVDNITGVRTALTPGADGSYTVPSLRLGGSYTVVANYRPMVVTYHKGGDTGDELDISLREPGSQLGKSPLPLNTAERVGDGYVLLGWTLTAPADDAAEPFHRVDHADALPLAGEETQVNRPMELWPVYVKTVEVQSNIDAALTNDGQSLTDVRCLTIPNLNVASGTLTAQENVTVGADTYYVFTGWYTGYESPENPGERVTANAVLTLSGSGLYATGVTYTAVYETAYRVTYHGDDADEIVYTVMVPQSDSRTFVTTAEVPGEDGTTTTMTIPVDVEAFTGVEDCLANNQVFREWQYVPADDVPQRWDTFCGDPITQNMDLYPVAFTVTAAAKDPTLETLYRGSDSTEPIDQSKLEVKIGLGTIQQRSGGTVSSVSVLVMSEYTQEELTISVQENAYAPSGTVSTPEPEVPVNLNLRRNADLTQSDSKASRLYGSRTTDAQGDARFSLTGSLTIAKVLADSGSAGDAETFLIHVAAGGMQQLLPLKAGGTITMPQIPYGQEWTVAEDEGWAWRYQGTVSQAQGQITSYHDAFTVTITNRDIQSGWFDGAAYTHNVFGIGASGGETQD